VSWAVAPPPEVIRSKAGVAVGGEAWGSGDVGEQGGWSRRLWSHGGVAYIKQ
jgi:hypothetical protein